VNRPTLLQSGEEEEAEPWLESPQQRLGKGTYDRRPVRNLEELPLGTLSPKKKVCSRACLLYPEMLTKISASFILSFLNGFSPSKFA
jgi:hypothetical protein